MDEMLFEPAADPGSWVKLMDEICAACGSAGALLIDTEVRTPNVLRTAGIEDLVRNYFRDDWHKRDLRYATIPRMCKEGIGVDQDFASPEMISKNPYYTELFEPLGFRWFAGIPIWAGSSLSCLALQRTIEQGYFDPAEQTHLAQL